MAGLPVAVQVVGQRLQEEKMCAIMERIEEALDRQRPGGRYQLLEPYEVPDWPMNEMSGRK